MINGQKSIYDFVDKEKLDVVNKPITESHGLPNECYRWWCHRFFQ